MLFDIDRVKVEHFECSKRHRISFKRWVTDPAHKAKVDALRSSVKAYTSKRTSKVVHGPQLGAMIYAHAWRKKY